MDWAKSQTLWMSLFHIKNISTADVSTIIFGCGDPGDSLFGSMTFEQAVAYAERSKFEEEGEGDDRDEHEEDAAWFVDTSGDERKKAAPPFMPLHNPTRAEIDSVLRRKCEERPARVGTLAFPCGPFAGLSLQGQRLMLQKQEKREQATSLSDEIATGLGRTEISLHTPTITKFAEEEGDFYKHES
jgi:hypothetical protein